jgi:hypothetical protein
MQRILKNKRFLLVAGVAIGLVTLFSHSLRVEISNGKKQSSELTADAGQHSIIVVPSDAVTVNLFSFHADGLLQIAPALYSIKKVLKVVPFFQKTTTHYFQTLFRFIISPNAP